MILPSCWECVRLCMYVLISEAGKALCNTTTSQLAGNGSARLYLRSNSVEGFCFGEDRDFLRHGFVTRERSRTIGTA